MKYRCVESFIVDKCDDDGFTIENNYMVIDTDQVYESDKSGYMMIGGENHIHLDNVEDGSWIEITKDMFDEYFEEVEKKE